MRKTKKQRGTLVTNLTTATPAAKPKLEKNQLQRFTWNLSTKLVRNDKMEGRAFLVVPMVMMVVGVHNGSRGPLLYPEDELSKTPEAWNHKPVVVNHPSDAEGNGISACSPEVINQRKIGVIMNTRFDELGRLCAEAWLDEERTKEIEPRILDNIKAKKAMECSTGLFTDNEAAEGDWNGEKYDAIARNYRPDHLAVLPDDKGACSLEDGAGFIRNQVNSTAHALDGRDRDKIVLAVLEVLTSKHKDLAKKVTANEASYDQIRQMIYRALETKFPSDKGFACPWIEAVYDNWFVYCMGSKLFRQGYSSTDTTVKLTGEPMEVQRSIQYQVVNAAPAKDGTQKSAGTPPVQPNKNTMNKEQIVADLIANHGHSPESREKLMGLDDNTLAAIHSAAKLASNAKKETPAGSVLPKVEAPKAPATVDEFIGNAPKEMQDVLRSGVQAHNAEKTRLIETIVANKANVFSKEVLQNKTLDELKGIAALAAASAPAAAPAAGTMDFSALGHAAPIDNNAAKGESAALPSTSWEFAKK